jgi:hypothetical protein
VIRGEFQATAADAAGFGGAASDLGAADPAGLGFAAGSPGFCAGTGSTLGGLGAPAGALGSPLGGGVGDLVSSGIATKAQTSGAAELQENDNF